LGTVLEGIRKITAWELVDRFAVEVYRITRHFPHEESYGLTSQFRRAAVSVPANIAEGSQRQYLKEYLQLLYTAKASLSEAEYYIHLAQQLGYLQDDALEPLIALQTEASKTLHGLIRWQERQIAAGKATKKDLRAQRKARSRE
jgi:four helix bundle protein